MVSDASIPNAPKDITKKKRANRSAKLKQCKLDARREQFLSQVKKKGVKEIGNGNGCVNGEFDGSTFKTTKTKGKEVRNVCMEVIDNHGSDSDESSLTNSPTSSVNNLGNNYSGSSSSSASSLCFSNGGYCSGNITEEEEEGGEVEFGDDDGCLDDWEAMADALVGSKTNNKQVHDSNLSHDEEVCSDTDNQQAMSKKGDEHVEETETERSGILCGGRVNNKAWRPDDAFRPQSLPNLSKHWSSPANSEKLACHGFNPWVRKMPPVPTSCPICCEDLDLTDSSFLPCPCGFRLCLFCHKRILEEDSRCPGCRKPYTSEMVEKETSITSGSLTIRLARSCSTFSRV
ncbi:hypothetical protein RND81_13G125400 [Saponaria officinalis]|uniref:RING-type domain-containing protein n=1 Tax=Saponaria officinalis TaxID=3572 RepID=A0AAW1GZ66_SAPOF